MNASSRFTSVERIKKTSEFSTVYNKGKRYFTKNLIVFVLDNKGGFNRLGLSISKKVGKAYIRNNWRRRLREFFRLYKEKFGMGKDIVIVVKKEAGLLRKDAIWQSLENEMPTIFKKIVH